MFSIEKETIVVSFSGGRTSGFMCWFLQNHMSHLYNFVYVYANTGQEHEKTLEFVNNVDKLFNLNLVWVEAKVNEGRKGTTYNIVDFESASRNGEPFEEVIKKYGLPNKYFIHCTRELKLSPIHSWAKDNGYKNCRQALGIRYDEFRRVKNDKGYIFPLATIVKVSKEDVLSFWKEQPFDLDIPEHYGNCIFCYKKSDKKLWKVAQEIPEAFDFIKRMEEQYPRQQEFNIFRHNRDVKNILNNDGYPDGYDMSSIDECGEECGVITLQGFDEKEKEAKIQN